METGSSRGRGRPRKPDGWTLSATKRGYYAVEYRAGQRTQRVALGTRDPAEAAGALAELREATSRPGGALTLARIMDYYIDDRASEGKSTSRMEQAQQYLDPLMVYKPRQINRRVVKEYIKLRQEAGVSNGAIRTDLAYLVAALRIAVRDELIDKAPDIPLPPPGEPRDHYLHRKYAAAFLEAIEAPHAKLFATLALATAARPSHILELTWDRVNLDRRFIQFADPLRAANKKGRPTVPINDMAMAALMTAQIARTSEWVIEIGGRPVKSCKTAIETAGNRIGVKMTPYVLRHTAGVWMAEDGVPMEQIAQYMGHASIETTRKHYARYSPDYLQGAARSLNVFPTNQLIAEGN